ncbi:MAG: YbhB/YbcL family Raf kinase inhibitor-like protein, partial [Bacteroidales bacterium]|nr:YbhB/YbcL family Raf kinase inhibitor-like protein [Bacteroidales bacterium]
MQVTSIAFQNGNPIPVKYTCDGEDISPPLSWTGVPETAQSLVLIVDDPDAPAGVWVHWVIYDIAPDLDNLPEGLSTDANVTRVGVQGQNDFQNTGYSGPCPPGSKPHRYYFKLYALDQMLHLPPEATKAEVEEVSVSNVQQAINGIIGRNPGIMPAATSIDIKKVYSREQAKYEGDFG